MKLIYLALPYSKYPYGREAAFKEACAASARVMQSGYGVFCPIAHSHSIEVEGMDGNIMDGDWWLEQDFAVLSKCDELWVYQMPGWDQSYGVGKEIEFAKQRKIPIKWVKYYEKNTAGIDFTPA